MPLGKVVGFGPGHIVLDADPGGTRPPQQPLPTFGPCLLWAMAKRSPISATTELLYHWPRIVEYWELECGPMPNVMVALPNIGGALCSTPQSFANAHYLTAVQQRSKMRNPLKFAGFPQTRQQISAASRPKLTVLWGHLEDILLLSKFFFRLSIRALVAKI